MKKILTHLTAIVLFIAGLITGSCQQAVQLPPRGPEKVKIYLRAIKKDGKKHLKMHNHYDKENKKIDTLETLVNPGDTVVWELRNISRIENIIKISPSEPGVIMSEDATPIQGTKSFMFIVPENIQSKTEREKYDIKFLHKQGDTITIDPYLKIR